MASHAIGPTRQSRKARATTTQRAQGAAFVTHDITATDYTEYTEYMEDTHSGRGTKDLLYSVYSVYSVAYFMMPRKNSTSSRTRMTTTAISRNCPREIDTCSTAKR